VRTLATLADHIPRETSEQLLPIIATIAKRQAPAAADFLDDPRGRGAAGEAANLAVALGGLEVDDLLDRLTDLVAGEAGDRRWAAQVAGQSGRPEDVGILMALAADGDPDVRAAAASGLAALVAEGRGGAPARIALKRCISDPGARVPANVAGTLRAVGGDVADELLATLREHPSAYVRAYSLES
jgi:HEAT repeat protein